MRESPPITREPLPTGHRVTMHAVPVALVDWSRSALPADGSPQGKRGRRTVGHQAHGAGR